MALPTHWAAWRMASNVRKSFSLIWKWSRRYSRRAWNTTDRQDSCEKHLSLLSTLWTFSFGSIPYIIYHRLHKLNEIKTSLQSIVFCSLYINFTCLTQTKWRRVNVVQWVNLNRRFWPLGCGSACKHTALQTWWQLGQNDALNRRQSKFHSY